MAQVAKTLARIARSIRFRIIVTAMAVFSFSVFVLAFGIISITNTRAEQVVALPLTNTANAICEAISSQSPLPTQSVGVDGLTYFQIISGSSIDSGYLPPGPEKSSGSQNKTVSLGCASSGTLSVVRDVAELEDSRQLLTERVARINGEPYRIVVVAALRAGSDTVDQLVLLFRIGVPLLVIFVALLLWVVVTRALRPVDALRKRAEEISESTLDKRLPLPGYDDELGRLAESLNSMLDRLERANENQKQFVSDASHELRSPAATIVALSEVLNTNPKRLPELVPQLHAEATRLASLVDVLIELARAAEQQNSPLEFVAVHDILLADAERLQAPADMRDIGIDTTNISQAHTVASKSALIGIVRNLTDNALRHAKSEVVLSCHENDTTVVLEIGDDGPGVPDGMREKIFDRFARIDSGRGRSEGGTGIGLALVRDLTTSLGGEVEVKSSQSGGALFVVKLPRATV